MLRVAKLKPGALTHRASFSIFLMLAGSNGAEPPAEHCLIKTTTPVQIQWTRSRQSCLYESPTRA